MIKKTAYVENMSVGSLAETGKDNEAIQARFASVTEALRDEQRKRGDKELSKFVDEFVYASCIMMHAAEASLINQETGEPILNKKGEPVKGWFEETKDKQGRKSVVWNSPDGIQIYRNQNFDIFPESELVKAHKEWIGKPLCKDHVSNTIDGVRGVIVDTYYDPKFKRVHALFALDKKNYPDLARKVEAGYAPNVSMGTGVGRSVCSECANVATAAHEFCAHVKNRSNYGEINLDLSPIELSIVVVGADPKAKIRRIIASMDKYRGEADALRKVRGAPLEAIAELEEQIDSITEMANSPISQEQIESFKDFIEGLASFKQGEANELVSALSEMMEEFPGGVGALATQLEPDELKRAMRVLMNHGEDALREPLAAEFKKRLLSKSTVGKTPSVTNNTKTSDDPILSNYNSEIAANPMATDLKLESPVNFMDNGSNMQIGASFVPTKHLTSIAELENMAILLANKIASIKNNMDSLNSNLPPTLSGVETGEIMSFKDLGNRAKLRANAYAQGTEEPKTYPAMGDVNLREKDKHMVGDELNTTVDNPDQKTKDMLSRASIDARAKGRAEAMKAIANATDTALKDSSGKVVAVVDGDKGKVTKVENGVTKSQMADDGKAEEKEEKDEVEKTASFKNRVQLLVEAAKSANKEKEKAAKEKAKAKAEKEKAKEKAAKEKEKTLAAKAKEKAAKEKAKEKAEKEKEKEKAAKEKAKKLDKKAYPQGTEEVKVYPAMGDVNLREKDKHMSGDELDLNAANPDQKIKDMLSRAHVRVTLKKSASPAEAAWTVLANDEAVLSFTAEQAFGDAVNDLSEDVPTQTNAEVFASRAYGLELLKAAKSGDLVRQAAELGLDMVGTEEDPLEADKAAPAAELDAELDPMVDEADKALLGPGMDMDMGAPVGEADLKERAGAVVERMEENMAELREVVLGPDEGVDNLDIELAPAVAALNSKLLKGYAIMDSLASELRYVKASADLSNPAVKLAARAALRDAAQAELEVIQILAELEVAKEEAEEKKEADCADMNLDDQDLHEVRDEISGALENHEETDHAALMSDLDTLQEEISTLADEDKLELNDAAEALKGALHAHDQAMADDGAKRAAFRAGLVARAAAVDSARGTLLDTAHKGDDKEAAGSHVSNKIEAQEAAMAVVNKEPKSSVKQAAAGLDKAIRSGQLKVAQLDYLVSIAAVDAEAAKYWREYYGEVDKSFATEISAEFKKATASSEDSGIRYKRAFAVATEAQSKGLIDTGRASLEACVDSLVSGTDDNFEAFKSLASKIKAPTKSAGYIPQMGVDPVVKTASKSVNLNDPRELAKALWGDVE